MIIKSISAENFGKFDRYSVNLDDNINVFYGDNEAGKTTLYEIISILLFAPQTDKEMVESNKLIKTDEKYARVYAIINIEGKEISIAREIFFNNTNLSIADQDNVSSLGNVNVPFIGDLSKEMYESFHTIDYYNMATITNNVWDQIIKVIEDSRGEDRTTPDYSTPEEEENAIKKSSYEDDIKAKEKEKSKLQKALKEAQKKQKRMIRNQDKIDDLIGELEDVENNIELETSYLKEAEKMNQIRSTIKKTQDLTLELEKYKNLKPWLPNLRKYYERLKLYSENIENGIVNPVDMFDDLEIKPEEEIVIEQEAQQEAEPVIEQKDDSAEPVKEEIETKSEKTNDNEIKEEVKEDKAKEVDPIIIEIKDDYKYTKVTLPSEEDYNQAREKINKFIENNYLNKDVQKEKAEAVQEEVQHKPEEEPKKKILSEFKFRQVRKVEVEPIPEEKSQQEAKIETKSEKTEKTELEKEKIEKVQPIDVEPGTNEEAAIDIEPLEDIEPTDKFEPEKEITSKEDSEEETKMEELPPEVKPLSIRKPKDMRKDTDEEDETLDGYTNRYGQTNPYSDNVLPDMDDVSYSGKNISKKEVETEDGKDKYSLSSSNDMPMQSQQVPDSEMEEEEHGNPLLKAEEYLNNVDMKEIIAASKETVEVDGETQDQIDKAQLRYKIIGQRVFEQEMDMEDVTAQLKALDTNAIYKTIVKFKGLSQKQRKAEHSVTKTEKAASGNSTSIALGAVAFFSMLLGVACFFIEQIISFVPSSELTNMIYQVIIQLPFNNVIPGNILSGGAFVLIAILLTVAIILGNDSDKEFGGSQQVVDEVEIEDLKNKIRLAKREVVDSLKGFPLPASYLENPNNSIITVINELREAEGAYRELVHESTMPKNAEYRKMWELAKANLTEDEISEDLFDNISRLRRKIQGYKEDEQEKERKIKDARAGINMFASPGLSSEKKADNFGQNNNFGLDNSQPTNSYEPQQDVSLNSFGITPTSEQQPEKNASENSSFVLPSTQSQDVSAPEYTPEPINEMPTDSLYPKAEIKDTSYPGSGDNFETAADNNFPGTDTTVDNSYPDSGGMFGGAKDVSYPTVDGEFGKLEGGDYPFKENDTPTGVNYPASEDTAGNDLGIPGINRYSGESAEPSNEEKTDNDPFGIPGVHRYGTDTAAQEQSGADEDPYAIPGVKKYNNDYPQANEEKTEDDPYAIPGVHKYTSDSSTQNESTNDDPFGIPGVHRYGSDAGAQEQSTDDSAFEIPGINKYSSNESKIEQQSAPNNPFDIPGVNKYSQGENEDTSSSKNEFGIPGIHRYNSMDSSNEESAATENPFKGNDEGASNEKDFGGFPSGLPGMDKFSNRSQEEGEEYNPFKKIKNALPGEPKDEPIVDVAAQAVVDTAIGAAAGTVEDAAETVPFAGAVFSGGLPGLDKFSNRSEQEKEQPIAQEKPAQETPAQQADADAEVQETVSEELAAEPVVEEQKAEPTAETVQENTEPEEAEQLPEETAEAEVAAQTAEDEAEVATDAEQSEPEPEEEIEEQPVVKPKDRHQREYDELVGLLGDDSEATIREVEQLTRDLHREVTQRDEGMSELLKLNDAAVRLSTLSSNKWPYKQKAIDASMERIDYLEADKLKIGRHLKMLEEKIDNVEYEDTPQAIADRLKEIDEEIDQLKLENDKHALAEELIEKQKLLDMSSNDDRSHIVEDTSVYMKELTLGKYVEVKINDDQSGLSICDKDGQWFDTTKDRLSQATREQLYLALRISIADLFDEKSIIFPMFFDEALITWDKRRMKAVMRLLSKMSMHRQVIIFTCHDWLKDMISDYLIGAKIIVM